MSTNRAARGVYSSPAPRDLHGNKLCRNCRGPMPKGRRHNCSPACSEAWVCKTSPGYMRRKVFERDRGVCAQCGIDTEYFWRQLPNGDYKAAAEFAKQYGVPAGRVRTDWWDADHRVPVD